MSKRTPLCFSPTTVLQHWFQPMHTALQSTRTHDASLSALPTSEFIVSGCLRQLLETPTLREFVQTLFHHDSTQSITPVARSTWSDALACPKRCAVLHQACTRLVTHAQSLLPDRLACLADYIKDRAVIATDATYLSESAHYRAQHPSQGGTDNQKGHMVLSHFDVRKGIAISATVQTQSMGEMRVLKEALERSEASPLNLRRAIHVVDRAYIDGTFWDKRLSKYASTVITRLKSTLKYSVTHENPVPRTPINDGVLSDRQVQLNCSKYPWRLIGFRAPNGECYEYITNDLSMPAGVVAFLYHRRWDKEKYYDSFKNSLAGAKAWGKRSTAIEQQTMMGIVTVVLTMLFMRQKAQELGRSTPNSTQQYKHQAKQAEYKRSDMGVSLRASWTELSQIPRQLWRFLKNCFACTHEPALYKRQMAPLMERYI
jgi:hypothetical protein